MSHTSARRARAPHASTALVLTTLTLGAAGQTIDPVSAAQAPTPARAASAPPPTAPAQAPDAAPTAAVQRVTITGNPLAADDIAQATSALSGDKLLLQRRATLGDLLDGQPGVAATRFGPNASRPIVRGLDGDRVKLLDNFGASTDASSLSFDHAVAMDPLVAERVEVLRGPASLLYGGNATGGAVNLIDNRIPRTALDAVGGRAELRLGGAVRERALSGLIEGGANGLNWHVDAFGRRTSDMVVPDHAPVADDEPLRATDRVRNSASHSSGGAVGASWADADGYVGAAVDTYRNDYGVTVEPDVSIAMKRSRFSLAGERALSGWFSKLTGRASHTRYEHREIEGTGEVGTTFTSRSSDARLELQHGSAGAWRGVWGVQGEQMRFSALGEEAFVPGTYTRSAALFALEQAQVGATTVEAGLRLESVRVRSDGDAPHAREPRFGAASERSFRPISASLSMRLPLQAGWSLSAVTGLTQRAPAYYELYANGAHIATAAYERGDPDLPTERSLHIDGGLAWKSGASLFGAHAYMMRFSRFISLDATGANITLVGEDGEVEEVPEYAFISVPARVMGMELEASHRIRTGAWAWDLGAALDFTRATQTDADQPLPRIAPMRLTLHADASWGDWTGGASVKRAMRQSRVSAGDTATPGYTLLNLWLARRLALGGADATAFVRLDNVTNALGYDASTVASMRPLAPLAGRALAAGVQVSF